MARVARALWHCAGNDDSKVIIAESGGIPPLVGLLKVTTQHQSRASLGAHSDVARAYAAGDT